jgi:hypothetical protein
MAGLGTYDYSPPIGVILTVDMDFVSSGSSKDEVLTEKKLAVETVPISLTTSGSSNTVTAISKVYAPIPISLVTSGSSNMIMVIGKLGNVAPITSGSSNLTIPLAVLNPDLVFDVGQSMDQLLFDLGQSLEQPSDVLFVFAGF